MNEIDAQQILFARAVEDVDRDGLLLSRADLDEARREAASHGSGEVYWTAFAAPLTAKLKSRLPGLGTALRGLRSGGDLAWPTLTAALLLGLATNLLGPDRRINVLHAPLFLLVAWNLLVYAALIVGSRRAKPRDSRDESHEPGRLAHFVEGIALKIASRAVRRGARHAELTERVLARFGGLWRRAAGRLIGARAEALFHLGAIFLVVGAVAGMYLRGLFVRFEATWESTFLPESGVRTILNLLLRPAAALTGREIPEVRGLDRTPGDAAPWIHLYALSAAVYVVLPRALLLLAAARRVRRLAAAIAVGDADPAVAAQPKGGRDVRVRLVSFSYEPTPRALDGLRNLAHEVFGTAAEVDALVVAAYDDDAADVCGRLETRSGQAPGPCIVVFVAAQTPESEVHGRFVTELKQRLGSTQCLILVDLSTYRNRALTDDRIETRSRLWERIAREAGAEALVVDLDQPTPKMTLDRLRTLASHPS